MDNRNILVCGDRGMLAYAVSGLEQDGRFNIRTVRSTDGLAREMIDWAQEILIADASPQSDIWTQELFSMGVSALHRMALFVVRYELPVCQDGGLLTEYLDLVHAEEAYLPYLETQLEDMCNLKCRACNHFSNLITQPHTPGLEQFERDLRKLHELFPSIYRIRLMGGEPLLNREIEKYLSLTRKYYPKSDLRIVTNGLLLPKMQDSFYETVRKEHIVFDISPYPPTIKMMPEIKRVLAAQRVYTGGTIKDDEAGITSFFKLLKEHPTSDPGKAMQTCCSGHCRFLREGKIAKCEVAMMIPQFNEHFGTAINEEGHDIYDLHAETDGAALRKKLDAPANMCRYCSEVLEFADWGVAGKDKAVKEDWLVDG